MNQLVKLGVTALFISGVTQASSHAVSIKEVVSTSVKSTQTEEMEAEFLDFYKTAAVNGYNSASPQPTEALLDVPLLNQMDSPRLYNGCEVTSLAMMLLYKGFEVTKNELADSEPRVPLTYSNGDRGNPNTGFVGNMEDGPGLGVYHGPIFELARQYSGDRAEDLTGQPFSALLKQVADGNPIWVITTSTFAPVSSLETWQTRDGAVGITYSMHSVVITGYDSDHIYINNPYGVKNQAVDRENFIKAWEQMGEQAVVVH